MKFRKRITTISTLRRQDFYEFSLTKEQIEEAKKRTYQNPFMIYKDGTIVALFYHEGKLMLNYFISYYGFTEGLGEHNPRIYDNMVLCSCGKKFPNGKRGKGKENFDKHIQEIERLKNEVDE